MQHKVLIALACVVVIVAATKPFHHHRGFGSHHNKYFKHHPIFRKHPGKHYGLKQHRHLPHYSPLYRAPIVRQLAYGYSAPILPPRVPLPPTQYRTPVRYSKPSVSYPKVPTYSYSSDEKSYEITDEKSFEKHSLEVVSGGAVYQEQLCSGGLVRNILGNCVKPVVSNNLYVYKAPSSPIKVKKGFKVPKPKVHYNYVYVKASNSANGPKPIVIPPPKEKTKVFVINKEPHSYEQEVIEFKKQVDEPEVFFVNYKDGENLALPGGVDLKTVLARADDDIPVISASGRTGTVGFATEESGLEIGDFDGGESDSDDSDGGDSETSDISEPRGFLSDSSHSKEYGSYESLERITRMLESYSGSELREVLSNLKGDKVAVTENEKASVEDLAGAHSEPQPVVVEKDPTLPKVADEDIRRMFNE